MILYKHGHSRHSFKSIIFVVDSKSTVRIMLCDYGTKQLHNFLYFQLRKIKEATPEKADL